MLATVIDSVIIVLLIGSIAYGYMVSRKVRILMATLKDLEPLVLEFSSAVDKSEESVHQMRESIEAAEASPWMQPAPEVEETPEEAPAEAAFASRRNGQAEKTAEIPGLRVMRDKKDLVRKFFENTAAAGV